MLNSTTDMDLFQRLHSCKCTHINIFGIHTEPFHRSYSKSLNSNPVYEDDDEDDEEEECFVTTCPECEEEVYFDETVLEDGEVVCPNCGAKLEFDLSDLAAAAEDGEDEE